jgi:hypothetical protein
MYCTNIKRSLIMFGKMCESMRMSTRNKKNAEFHDDLKLEKDFLMLLQMLQANINANFDLFLSCKLFKNFCLKNLFFVFRQQFRNQHIQCSIFYFKTCVRTQKVSISYYECKFSSRKLYTFY